MEGPCAPSTSGRAMLPLLSTSSLLVGMLLASCALASAQWVVETNSFHIREPANVEGEYDSAIGDVSSPAACCPKIQGYTGMVHACCAGAGSSKNLNVAHVHPCHYARRALKSVQSCYTEKVQAVCASRSMLASYPLCKQAIRQQSMRLLCLCAVWGTSVWRRPDGGDCVH